MIAIVDYGMGNVRSLSNAFEYLGEDVIVTDDPLAMDDADRIVLPGVGAFGDAMQAMHQRGVIVPLNRQVLELRKPLLGICLGMQLVAKESVEHGHHQGLGWVDARIERLTPASPLKVPHVGWNSLDFPARDWLFEGIRQKEANFYFVHSFHMVCANPQDRIATTDYGGDVTAVVRHGNIVVMQFHPEKSQDNGLRLLQNWVNWSA
ncbi:MAG: imidazole glycerol phosphate synthase subunit HisH [Rhodocyclales bacterium]|nr:imidazole glycerol phosphate synthase subunit HisH [Rhodocyclales bacterium]